MSADTSFTFSGTSARRQAPARRARYLKRLFAISAFIAGGLAAELQAPLQCTLIPGSAGAAPRAAAKRRKV